MHQGEEQEEPKMTSLLPPDAFLNVFEAGDPGTIEHDVVATQQEYKKTMKQWEKTISITPSEVKAGDQLHASREFGGK
jgi:hypothetical protein